MFLPASIPLIFLTLIKYCCSSKLLLKFTVSPSIALNTADYRLVITSAQEDSKG